MPWHAARRAVLPVLHMLSRERGGSAPGGASAGSPVPLGGGLGGRRGREAAVPRRGGLCAWGSALPGGRSPAGFPPICPGTSGAVSGQTRTRASDYRDCTNERVQARLVSRALGKGDDAIVPFPEIFLLPSPAARRSGERSAAGGGVGGEAAGPAEERDALR